jgi:hypothetical protein
MNAPPAQYTTTSDSVSIARTEAGDGPALLWCNGTPMNSPLSRAANLTRPL